MKPVDNQPPVLDPVDPFFTVEEVFYQSTLISSSCKQRNARTEKIGCEIANNRFSLHTSRKTQNPITAEKINRLKKRIFTTIATETNRYMSGFSVLNFTHLSGFLNNPILAFRRLQTVWATVHCWKSWLNFKKLFRELVMVFQAILCSVFPMRTLGRVSNSLENSV